MQQVPTRYNLRRERKDLYTASAKRITVVDVPPLRFLAVDGAGDPNDSPIFQTAIAALYGVAYTVKFSLKASHTGPDYAVMLLEGLWWMENAAFDLHRKEAWKWTLMIAQPDFVSNEAVLQARRQVVTHKDLTDAEQVRLETYHEGLAAQVLHVGPYATEEETIERLHRFIAAEGHTPRGKHHEIYLGDPRRSAPERLRTILRQPFA